MTYRAVFGRNARRGIRNAHPEIRGRIMERIELLCRNPRSGKRMVGRGDLYRDRVGSYRIVYSIKDDVRSISIVRIGLRKGVYKGI